MNRSYCLTARQAPWLTVSIMDAQPQMNNKTLGDLIGVTFSMASRLRSGDRTPGVDTMRNISEVFDFPLDAQFKAREQGIYARELCRAVVRYERANPAPVVTEVPA